MLERLSIPNMDLSEDLKNISQVGEILTLVCKLVDLILGENCVEGPKVAKMS